MDTITQSQNTNSQSQKNNSKGDTVREEDMNITQLLQALPTKGDMQQKISHFTGVLWEEPKVVKETVVIADQRIQILASQHTDSSARLAVGLS